MPIYQTEKTKRVLSRIRDVSNVRWNSGDLPTEYCGSFFTRLNISDTRCLSDPILDTYFDPMSLFESGFSDDRIQCTEDEFVDYCRRMRPKSKQGE